MVIDRTNHGYQAGSTDGSCSPCLPPAPRAETRFRTEARHTRLRLGAFPSPVLSPWPFYLSNDICSQGSSTSAFMSKSRTTISMLGYEAPALSGSSPVLPSQIWHRIVQITYTRPSFTALESGTGDRNRRSFGSGLVYLESSGHTSVWSSPRAELMESSISCSNAKSRPANSRLPLSTSSKRRLGTARTTSTAVAVALLIKREMLLSRRTSLTLPYIASAVIIDTRYLGFAFVLSQMTSSAKNKA